MSPFFTLLYLTRDTTTANDESFWIVSWNIHYYCVSKRKESWIVFTFYTLSLMLSYSILWFVSIYPVVIHGFEIVNNSLICIFTKKYLSMNVFAFFRWRPEVTADILYTEVHQEIDRSIISEILSSLSLLVFEKPERQNWLFKIVNGR